MWPELWPGSLRDLAELGDEGTEFGCDHLRIVGIGRGLPEKSLDQLTRPE